MENLKLYHLDRSKELSEGQNILLFNDYEYGQDESDIMRKIDANLKNMFPQGISEHGLRYIFNNISILHKKEMSTEGFISNTVCETIFEAIRAGKYPEKLSRFQSFFAVDEDGLKKIKIRWKGANFNVVQVTADIVFRYDMSLLKGDSFVGCSYFANEYWSGKSSDDPLYEYLLKPPVKIIKIVEMDVL